MFVVLRDGSGYLQRVMQGDLGRTVEAVTLCPECTVCMRGTLKTVPDNQNAPGGHELIVDYWTLVGQAPAGGIDNVVNKESLPDVQLDNRHLLIRGERTSKVLKLRSYLHKSFLDHYF